MEKREKNKQSLVLTRIKTLSVSVSLIILCSLFIKLCLHGFIYGFSWLVLPALFVGYLLADFITGTIHWFCDTFFDEETPVIGNFIIYSFREHHSYPLLITKALSTFNSWPGFTETNKFLSVVLSSNLSGNDNIFSPFSLVSTGNK